MENLNVIYSRTGGLRKYYLGTILFVCIETFFEILIPFLMADIIDTGIVNRDVSVFYTRGLLMLLCALLSLLFGFLYAKCAAKASALTAARIREMEFERIQSFSFSNIDDFETSGLITRLTSDITVLQNTITNGIRPIARGPIMLILGVLMCLVINWKLSLVLFLAGPVLGFVLVWIVSKVAPRYPLMQKSVDLLNGAIQENLVSIRLIKAFVREDIRSEEFDKINRDLSKITAETFHYAQLNLPAFQFSMYTCIVIIMILGVQMMLASQIQVGELTGILSYVLQIMNSFVMMSNVFLLLTRSMASINRIAQIFLEKNDMPVSLNPARIADGSVEFRDVSFKYDENGQKNVLENINLNIPSGSSVGIIGATGSAKSSLVSLIPRLYDTSEGEVIVGGQDVKNLDPVKLRDDVGMVLQKNELFTGTIEDNLKWGNPEATAEEIEQACRIACVDELLEKLPDGLQTMLSQGGNTVSGGQKQRICMARALLKKPKILIFDDSTSAVDTATEAKIRKGLKEIEDLTQIIIAQRISSVKDCDQIVILDDGKISDIGSHDDLLKRSKIYREICSIQERGHQK